MGFPCNQFGGQEPADEGTIKKFASEKFGVTFPMFSKVDVNGVNTHPVYQYLKTCYPGDITWNFASKFVVDRRGRAIVRFEKEPWKNIEAALEEALKASTTEEEVKQ